MKRVWWKLSILMMFVIIISPNLNPLVFETSGKISIDYHALSFSDYMIDWHINLSDSMQDTVTYVSDVQHEHMTFIDSNNVSADNSTDGPMDSAWPMLSYDVFHTGRSPYSTESNPGAEIWRVSGDYNGEIESSAVIDNDGIIYYGTMGSDHTLYALYPNGTEKWSYVANGLIWSTPAIAADGTIYLPSWGSHLFALYPTGQLKWDFGAQDPIASSVTIAEDGTIYVGTMGGNLFAINPNGSEQWHLYLGGNLISSPALGQDGSIYIGTTSHYLYAINSNGTIQWQFGANQFKGNPSIATDGTIYAPSFDGYLYALYTNGSMKWRVSTGSVIAAAGVALGEDGTIYVGTELLRAYYPNGTLKWSVDIQGDIYGTVPAVSADGTIYVSAGLDIVAVNPDGSIRWRHTIADTAAYSSPSIGPDGTVYVGSTWGGVWSYGYLHAFGFGPLHAEASGPYSGLASHTPVQFTGIAFGGLPPYTYLWNFGDGNASTEQNPSHLYQDIGTYNVTFTIIDNEGNTSNDTTTATITYGPPTAWYIKPEQALYIGNIRICKFPNTLILGKITVQADASHPLLDIDRIEFYLDFELQAVDDTAPYTWTWNQRYPLRAEHTHRIIIKAITTEGTEKTLGKEVHKYF